MRGLPGLLACCALLAGAALALASDDTGLEDDVDRTSLTSIKLPGELSLPSGFLHGLASAGAVVLGALGVAALLAVLLPLFGVKLCYLLGTCDAWTAAAPHAVFAPSQPLPPAAAHAYDTYSAPAAGYGASGTGYSGSGTTSYQRRSLEYVGPILRALSAAYDKYAAPRLVSKGSRAAPAGPPPTVAPAAAAAAESKRK